MLERRNIKLDNLKGILIYLVVLGHLLFSYNYYNSDKILIIVKLIYSFHMPIFLIISGYFSKDIKNKRLFELLIAFFLMNLSFIIFDYFRYGSFELFSIKYSSWYLLYLFIYRVLLKIKLFSNLIERKKFLLFYFLFVVFIGFLNLEIVRFFYYFYFFAFGYLVDLKKIKLSFSKSLLYMIIVFVFLIYIYLIFPFSLDFLMGLSYINNIEFLFRMCIICCSILLFIFMYNLIPGTKIKFITMFGVNSLSIYFFHRIFTLLITDYFIGYNYFFLLMVIFAIIICLVFGNYFVSNYFVSIFSKLWNLFIKFKLIFILVIIFLFCVLTCFYYKDDIYSYFYSPSVMDYETVDAIGDSFSIGFVGDLILLEDQVNSFFENGGYNFDDMFLYTKKYFNSVDYMIGVLEGPSDDSVDYSFGNFDDGKELRLNYPSSFLKSIKESGIDLVTLSNNHLLDRGINSVKNTVNNLNNISLDYVGAYVSNKENKRKIVDVKGIKIGILSYTYGINYYTEEQLFNEYNYLTNYLCNTNSVYFKDVKKSVISDFKYLKNNNVDLIIVLPHYGTQFSNKIDNYQKVWNDIFIENGADMILGDHSHSVQPILYKGNSLVVNSPGNFVNSYIDYDGDISMMVKIFVDRKEKKVIGASIIPLLAIKEYNRYISIPVYEALNLDRYTVYEDKLKYATEKVTKVSMNYKVSFDEIEEEYFYFNDGYKKTNKYLFELTDNDKNSLMYKLIENSDNVCFIGDSITEGTKNGYKPWYLPLISNFSNKRIYNYSKGGYTSHDIIDNYGNELKQSNCDLAIINIGTNDIRYNLTSADIYISNVKKILSCFRDSKIVLLSPWRTTDKDFNKENMREEKEKMYYYYDKELKELARNNENIYFIDVNKYISEAINDMGEDTYLLDGVHPNSDLGIKLYSYATLRD